MPEVSIITINFNNVVGLKNTVESVISQSFQGKEYIVIDGGSTDGSAQLIEQYSDRLTYWISEKDAGIYNAMNKGIKAAKGEYLLFLNSGDCFVNEQILEKVQAELTGAEIIYGNGILITESGELIPHEMPEALDLVFFSRASLFHPSTFIKRELFDRHGLYNEENRIVSDWEFFLKTIILHNVPVKKIAYNISMIEEGGISRKKENFPMVMGEIEAGLKRHFPPAVLTLLKEHVNLKAELKECLKVRAELNQVSAGLLGRILRKLKSK